LGGFIGKFEEAGAVCFKRNGLLKLLHAGTRVRKFLC
jgi:hypothetical protein